MSTLDDQTPIEELLNDGSSELKKKIKLDKGLPYIISSIVVGVGLLAFIITVAYTAATKVSWIGSTTKKQTYPISGTQLTIKSVSTEWFISDVEEDSKTMSLYTYTPSVKIKIGKEATSGKMRCYFINSRGKYIGDPITKRFKAGSFPEGTEITITCSEGYQHSGDFEAYYAGFTEPWKLLILEGAEDSETLSSFKEIASIPMERNLKSTLR